MGSNLLVKSKDLSMPHFYTPYKYPLCSKSDIWFWHFELETQLFPIHGLLFMLSEYYIHIMFAVFCTETVFLGVILSKIVTHRQKCMSLHSCIDRWTQRDTFLCLNSPTVTLRKSTCQSAALSSTADKNCHVCAIYYNN